MLMLWLGFLEGLGFLWISVLQAGSFVQRIRAPTGKNAFVPLCHNYETFFGHVR